MPKRKSNNITGYIFLIIFIGFGGYLLGRHDEKVKSKLEEITPGAKKIVKKSIKNVKDLSDAGLKKLKDLGADDGQDDESVEEYDCNDYDDYETHGTAQHFVKKEELKVCSFNIRIFSNKSRDDSELKNIAHVLKHCDITAIQELRDEKVLVRTTKILEKFGYDFDYIISPSVGNKVKERYAFLYNPQLIDVVEDGQLYDDVHDDFIREPYYATFKSGNFDFILVTIHLLYGRNKEERRPELIKLAQVYEMIQKKYPNENDIIMLGDFNFSPDDKGWNRIKKYHTMTYLIRPPAKTTVTDTSLYDNIWFQRQYVKEYTGKSGIIKFDENMFSNNDQRAKIVVSDHRPVWAIFKTTLDDD
ncbi:MAG: endonuclease/exonuclease/phosphatase family protein [Candidatus Omnitrophica bacterium]|nr:endonuclease/exonuclease/phosphatase family protein [Candidatus Omnitrophota bacterium]